MEYFTIQLNQAGLEKEFKQIAGQLSRHEDMILELQRLLKDRPTFSDLQALSDKLDAKLNSQAKDFNEKLQNMQSSIEGRLKNMDARITDLDRKMIDSIQASDLANRKRIDELEARIPKEDIHLSDFVDRLKFVEDEANSHSKQLNFDKDYIKTIATSIALLNGTKAELDTTLPQVLNTSTMSVAKDLRSINEEIEKLKSKPPSVIERRIVEEKIREAEIKEEEPVFHQNVDFESLSPYPSVVASWKDEPKLPPIKKFSNLSEVVDYVYSLVPKLQAFLNAMQGKIVDIATNLDSKMDKSLAEKMFEKLQSIIGELTHRVDDLKGAVEDTASRDEINGMVEDVLSTLYNSGQTAVGTVKCIACGRDIPQVSGAMTEAEAQKTLGNAPSSVAYKCARTSTCGQLGVQFSGKDGFDSAIIESPRSIHPYRSPPSPRGSRQRSPK